MPVRSREPGPEVGRGLHSAAGREVGGAVAKVPAAAVAPAHSSHLARPFPSRPCRAATPRTAHLPGQPTTKAAAATAANGGPRPAAAQPPPDTSPKEEPPQPRGLRALTPAERAVSPQTATRAAAQHSTRHRLCRSSLPSAAPRDRARTRGGREGEGGTEGVSGRGEGDDASGPRRCFRRRWCCQHCWSTRKQSSLPRWLARLSLLRWAFARRDTGDRSAQASRNNAL